MRIKQWIAKQLRLWRAMSFMKASRKAGREHAYQFDVPMMQVNAPMMPAIKPARQAELPAFRKVWRRFGKEMVRA